MVSVALVAPPYISCPPNGYGGIERVVAAIADGLVDAGYDVTLFAHPDSQTKARLVTPDVEQTEIFDFQKDALHASAIVEDLDSFDIVHNHSVALLLFRQWIRRPVLTTVHGTTHYDAVRPIYRESTSAPYVSISDRQRTTGLLDMNWVATVYNGVDTTSFTPAEQPRTDGYLLHIGTLCDRKGTAEAVQVALRADRRLVLAGRVDPINQRYFDERVAPFIDGEQVIFVGEVDGTDKRDLYRGAEALILPLNWHEPFGLVMAEAAACGVPTLVNDMGSAREVVADGITGFIGGEWRDMVENVGRVGQLDPDACRQRAVDRFSIESMIRGYEAVYGSLLAQS